MDEEGKSPMVQDEPPASGPPAQPAPAGDLVEIDCSAAGQLIPGAAPGISAVDLIGYLPAALQFLTGLVAGQSEIPAFRVRTPFGRKRVGPIPIVNE